MKYLCGKKCLVFLVFNSVPWHEGVLELEDLLHALLTSAVGGDGAELHDAVRLTFCEEPQVPTE
jgi:hypothetical protein